MPCGASVLQSDIGEDPAEPYCRVAWIFRPAAAAGTTPALGLRCWPPHPRCCRCPRAAAAPSPPPPGTAGRRLRPPPPARLGSGLLHCRPSRYASCPVPAQRPRRRARRPHPGAAPAPPWGNPARRTPPACRAGARYASPPPPHARGLGPRYAHVAHRPRSCLPVQLHPVILPPLRPRLPPAPACPRRWRASRRRPPLRCAPPGAPAPPPPPRPPPRPPGRRALAPGRLRPHCPAASAAPAPPPSPGSWTPGLPAYAHGRVLPSPCRRPSFQNWYFPLPPPPWMHPRRLLGRQRRSCQHLRLAAPEWPACAPGHVPPSACIQPSVGGSRAEALQRRPRAHRRRRPGRQCRWGPSPAPAARPLALLPAAAAAVRRRRSVMLAAAERQGKGRHLFMRCSVYP